MYEKHNWVNGEVITEDKLNHMEDGISTGGGICTYGEVTVFDDEVTTTKFDESDSTAWSGDLSVSEALPNQDISVTFNGQEYTLPFHNGVGQDESSYIYYGEEDANHHPVFTNYPLYIYMFYSVYDGDMISITTLDAGTYSIEIKVEKIVLSDEGKELFPKIMILHDSTSSIYLDKTGGEIKTAFDNDYIIVLKSESNGRMSYLTMVNSQDIYFIEFNSYNQFVSRHYTYSNPDDYPQWDGAPGE